MYNTAADDYSLPRRKDVYKQNRYIFYALNNIQLVEESVDGENSHHLDKYDSVQ